MSHVLPDLAWSSYVRTLKLRDRSQMTLRDYAYSYRLLTEFVGKPAVEASRLEIEAFLEARLELVSKTRVATDSRNLRAFFKWAVAASTTASPLRFFMDSGRRSRSSTSALAFGVW